MSRLNKLVLDLSSLLMRALNFKKIGSISKTSFSENILFSFEISLHKLNSQSVQHARSIYIHKQVKYLPTSAKF